MNYDGIMCYPDLYAAVVLFLPKSERPDISGDSEIALSIDETAQQQDLRGMRV